MTGLADLTLGFIPLTDCAPLVVAKTLGLFAEEGLAVTLSREASWATIRDKVAVGALHGAHMLAPMALAATVAADPIPMLAPLALNLDAVGVNHDGAAVLRDITATLGAGRCTVITGPSGAGKSTLMRLLNRLQEPTSGRILLDGTPLPDLDVLALRRRVGLVAQQPTLLTDRVLDELRVGAPRLTEDDARSLLAETGLPAGFAGRPTAGLSGGEAQRLCLARALALRPEVLLLDEPTSALDRVGAAAIERVVRDLRAAGGTAVLVSHDVAQARRLADDVLVLRDGLMAEQGTPDTVAYLQSPAPS